MIHDTGELSRMAAREPSTVAMNALRDIGVESVILSKKLFDNTQKMLLSAATHKDAKDVSRTMSAFVNSSIRDFSENVEAVCGIWMRFFRDTRRP